MHFTHLRKRPEQPVFFFFNTMTSTLVNQCRRIHLKHFNKRSAPPPSSIMLKKFKGWFGVRDIFFDMYATLISHQKLNVLKLKKTTQVSTQTPCAALAYLWLVSNTFATFFVCTWWLIVVKHSLWIEELACCEACLLFAISLFAWFRSSLSIYLAGKL